MNDESEEVFRRAAEHYPLKTDNPDWELMLQKMRDNPPMEEPEPKRKKNNRALWLLLLLLLPLAVIEWRYHFIFGSGSSPEKAAPLQDVSSQTIEGGNTHAPVPADGNADLVVKPFSQNIGEAPAKTSPEPVLEPGKVGSDLSSNSDQVTASRTAPNAQASSRASDLISPYSPKISSPIRTKKNAARKSATKRGKANVQITTPGEEKDQPFATRKAKPITDNAGIVMQIEAPALTEETATTDPKATEENIVSKTDQLISDSLRALKENMKAENTKSPTVPGKKEKTRRLYVGVLAGPDISSIKLQKIDKAGFSYGLIAGVHVSTCFDIEAGIFRDKKMYSSEGKYFSTKNLPLYPNTTISSVKGECKMWEIPLNVNFRFGKRENSNWLLAAGASGYFMQNEYYVFDVSRYGMNYAYASDYKSHDRQLFAVINIAAAYTRKLGKVADLRIQPYVKLPVNKVGTGELPIQSAGLMIGLTKDLF